MGLTGFHNDSPAKGYAEQTTQVVTMKKSSRTSAFTTRFGWITIALNLVGMIVVIGILVTFHLFWKWGEDQNKIEREEDAWERLALANFSEQTVTLLCAILRAFLSAQVLLCCYMLASYTTEKARLRKRDTDMIFIYQFANEGPLAMVGIFARSIIGSTGSKLHFFFPFVTLVFLLFTTIATQLSSTILLSDLTTQMIPNTTYSRGIPMTSPARTGCISEMANPYEYPIFAENATEGFFDPGDASNPGFYDSGWIHRAFIPLPKEERENIITYKGPANVLTTRTFCFPPPLNSSLEIPETFIPPWQVTKHLVDRLGEFGYTKEVNTSLFSNKLKWVTGVKHRISTTGETFGVIRGGSSPPWSSTLAGKPILLHQLVFNNPLGSTIKGDFEYSGEWVRRRQMSTQEARGQIPSAANQVDYSMCLRHFNWTDMVVEAETTISKPIREPVPKGESVVDYTSVAAYKAGYRFTWVMGPVRSLFNADRDKDSSKRVLKLTKVSELSVAVRDNHKMGIATGNYYCDWILRDTSISSGRLKNFCFDQASRTRSVLFNTALSECSNPKFYTLSPNEVPAQYVTPSRPYIDLINQTISNNGHPGQAIDFYDAILQANSYYANVPFFIKDNSSMVYNGTVRLFVERSIPTRRDGFRGVCALVGLHFFLFFVCYFAYLYTDTSRIGLEVDGISEFKELKRADTMGEGERSEELVALRSGEERESERR
ncbi:hypothetical protein BJ508DRAFT_302267 [Ascobolus immersus RN42]|uniref:Uncharacterized protein n=1 Tax=Ascobolus immersus RN42 TaxID=1160509 RepID=A0A3N4ILT9_ASCIM|nr:hypothetical protein BJ508DRAFT_302267 [Ascobolus immersus RN42]